MKKMSAKQIEQLAFDIRKFLLKWEMWMDVTIYFNGKVLSTDDRMPENINPKDYFEYAGGVLSMSFEGAFCNMVNYYEVTPAMDEFVAVLDKYNCFFELGNTWNLSVYYLAQDA